jgi:hypothetical protein
MKMNRSLSATAILSKPPQGCKPFPKEENAKPLPPQSFRERIGQEFIEGSAIAPSLYEGAIEIIDDSGLWEPNRALNQEVRAQWQIHKPHGYGAIAMLLNEDGGYWQGKPEYPRTISGKKNKYETPKGNGSRALLPLVPPEIRKRISKRYGVEVPLDGCFWDWLWHHPEIPILITEGGKKSLSLLSLGYVAIALYGINGGYSAGQLEHLIPPRLIEDIARFAVPGRMIKLAFDQDEAADTRKRVSCSLEKFGGLLSKAGAAIEIIEWNGAIGKGADDFIVARGAAAWEAIEAAAMPFAHWRILQRLKNNLSLPPSLQINSSDISKLDPASLPEEGIIGIASAKGTGKTKLIGRMLEGLEKVASAGHRISLQRNLSERLGLSYIGDLDKAGGRFISNSAYTLRVGFCVDSLLAIDPEAFRGCDLVLDEAVQIFRHILTSSTCSKDGKRPVLLARLKALIQVARRVIAADADLNDSALFYLQELREDGGKPFLLRNDFEPEGYDCRFISCPDKSAITAELLADIEALPKGKALLVATDGKGKHLVSLIQRQYPELRILLINSETISEAAQREMIENPDSLLLRGEYDLIIASPSMATGVSIQAHGIISKVYGIFTGGSSTDADMSQALSRVREPIPRVVWVADRGSNFSKAGTSTNPLELKNNLRESTAATIALIRSSLREDCAGAADSYDWQSDPHLNLWAKIEAAQNRSMWALRDSLLIRLRHEGNRIKLEELEKNGEIRKMLSAIREERLLLDAGEIHAADILRFSEVLQLENKEAKSPEEMRAVERFHICEFYEIAPEALSIDHILADKEGRRRGEILSLEAQIYPDAAIGRSARKLENQMKWNQGLCPWDLSSAPLRQKIRQHFGLDDYLDPDKEWIAAELEALKQKLLQQAKAVKNLLNFTVREEMSGAQMLGMMLSQLGLKTTHRMGSRTGRAGGKRPRIYRIDAESWADSMAILERRRLHRMELEAISGESSMGDEDLIEDCARMAAAAAESNDSDVVAEILGILAESLKGQPESKREIWARLSLEHRARLQGARAA